MASVVLAGAAFEPAAEVDPLRTRVEAEDAGASPMSRLVSRLHSPEVMGIVPIASVATHCARACAALEVFEAADAAA